MTHNPCLFCDIAQGKVAAHIVYQDEICLIFRDIAPQAPSHLLIVPIKHISSLDDHLSENSQILGHMLMKLAEYAHTTGLHEQGYRVVTNCGPQAGQSVYHLHFHLLSGRVFTWPPG